MTYRRSLCTSKANDSAPKGLLTSHSSYVVNNCSPETSRIFLKYSQCQFTDLKKVILLCLFSSLTCPRSFHMCTGLRKCFPIIRSELYIQDYVYTYIHMNILQCIYTYVCILVYMIIFMYTCCSYRTFSSRLVRLPHHLQEF